MHALHPLDYLVIAAYLAVVVVLGKIAAKHAQNQDGFFLAGRKLGKAYQYFLNFGNSTDAIGAVSTASIVYQQGAAGTWVGFQNIFLNPYYWFMNAWFRRVRLTTTADLFADRLGGRRLASFYALFQILCIVVVTAFSNLVAYKICAALIVRPEPEWTATERASVEGYRELKRLEKAHLQTPLAPVEKARLDLLREASARGDLHSYITALEPWSFYLIYTGVIGLYIILGGMAATALNEAFQGVLIVVFSVILLPTGLAAIGGWRELGARVPEASFRLFGGGASEITTWGIVAMGFAALLQVNGLVGNMGISGSARTEYAARFGAVAGTFTKRLMMILWTFAGLIAIALFSGADTLSDPDIVWGQLSLRLLGPGLLGLMLAGVLAANMSTVAAQTMAIAALFSRNVYGYLRPAHSDADIVRVARWCIAIVLTIALLAATRMTSVYTVLQLHMTLNVSFGTAVLFMFFWRRVTAPAVWLTVITCALLNSLLPLVADWSATLRTHPTLVARSLDASARPTPVFFEKVARMNPEDPASPLEGRGRLHTELLLLHAAGGDVARWTPGNRFAARFFVDAFLPPLLLILCSLATRPPPRDLVDRFFGKMKTPVGATPELEAAAMEETRRDPHRFDHLKLWPNSPWELTRWDRTDTLGFVASCALTVIIILLFWGLLRWAAP
jgi:Na+/proline symporter